MTKWSIMTVSLNTWPASRAGVAWTLYLEGVSGKNLEDLGALLAPLGRAVYFGDTHFSSETQIAVKQLRAGNWTAAGDSLGGLTAREPQYWRPSAAAVLGMIANGTLKDTTATLLHPTRPPWRMSGSNLGSPWESSGSTGLLYRPFYGPWIRDTHGPRAGRVAQTPLKTAKRRA